LPGLKQIIWTQHLKYQTLNPPQNKKNKLGVSFIHGMKQHDKQSSKKKNYKITQTAKLKAKPKSGLSFMA
jgi:hypothetical protein